MSCKVQEQEIFYEASKVYWGKEECREVTMVADVAGSLTDEYFDLNALDQDGTESSYYVLLSGTTPGVDPMPAGKTKIEVTYADDDSASDIAALMVTAIDALDGFSAEQIGDVVHIENSSIGSVSEEINTNAPSLTFTSYNGIGGYLGRTSDGIEIAMETTVGEVKSNQTSEILLDEIVQGQSGSCTAAFIELTKERLETLIAGSVGGTFTPAGGTKLIGGGSSRLSSSLKAASGKLILHPIRLADEDRSRDFVFWSSAPKPESINYSGTDIQALNCTFTAYLDDSKPSAINLYSMGDWKQSGVVA